MLFYVMGSLLFLLTLVVAVGVIATHFAQYRGQMGAALRTLSLDSVHARHRPAPERLAFRKDPARPALRPAA